MRVRVAPGRRAVFFAWALVQLAGCSLWSREDPCVSVEEYQEVKEAPDLTVPQGLDRPDTAGRLNIPPAPPGREPLSQSAGCLQQPPSYFDKPLKEGRN